MQLRRGEFGKKGQVKHSHLTDVDTTDMSAAWAQSSKVVQRREPSRVECEWSRFSL
ncbi:unnamed protein product [Effrenium voratum]|uniref:Uncharacterized protein n=1 Tax=Effrenium voratum TaxID=2562239 RepID=A0AA36J4Z2_9DINO|nr:unnamed protein product [Effrenium voratum]